MATSMPTPSEFWVRDDQGGTFGPLSCATIELFLENGMFKGALMASADGLSFDVPGNFPDLRDAFPRALWGIEEEKPAAPFADERTPTPPSAPHDAESPLAGLFDDLPADSAGSSPVPPPQEPPAAPAGLGRLPFAGALSFELQPLNLCHRAVSESATGLITFQAELRRYALYFRKGTLESVESPRLDEDIGAFAVAQRTLTPDELQQARARGVRVRWATAKAPMSSSRRGLSTDSSVP